MRKTDKVPAAEPDITELTDEGLKDELLKHGVDAGPIVGESPCFHYPESSLTATLFVLLTPHRCWNSHVWANSLTGSVRGFSGMSQSIRLSAVCSQIRSVSPEV